MNTFEILDFNTILKTLSDFALSENAKKALLNLKPFLKEKDCKLKMEETTQAKKILDSLGSPPISFMHDLEKILEFTENDSMLVPEQLSSIAQFIYSCNKMKTYLKKAEYLELNLALYGNSFGNLDILLEEIENTIHNNQVKDTASSYLKDIRRKILTTESNIQLKAEAILKNKKECFSDNYIVTRNDILVLPVKKTHRRKIEGTVVDTSSTGSTLFIQPSSIQKLQDELSYLKIEEDSEIRKILYILTAMVEEYSYNLNINKECMEILDIAFAKAKFSEKINAISVPITTERKLKIIQGRHPLINKENCVPLDFNIGDNIKGVIITGPNTGGKTVAIKTIGLLSIMAQSGLHVPVEEGSIFSMYNNVLCDIGDGQSITENLSTFSAHLTNIIKILNYIDGDSLVLLDELGSGTDPDEGMGIAIAILEELRIKNCLFVATTHYPEVKEYAKNKIDLINARMDFDREKLMPLYKLQLGEAGRSCALHIAQKLGFPEHMLYIAEKEVYGKSDYNPVYNNQKLTLPRIEKDKPVKTPKSSFVMGDSVEVGIEKQLGIVYKPEDELGDVIVQIYGIKKKVNYKQLKLKVSAEELYPEDYDFSIIFNTIEERNRIKKGYTF